MKTTWGACMVIDSVDRWSRNSQTIQFMAYLTGLSDDQVDDLFRAAAKITA